MCNTIFFSAKFRSVSWSLKKLKTWIINRLKMNHSKETCPNNNWFSTYYHSCYHFLTTRAIWLNKFRKINISRSKRVHDVPSCTPITYTYTWTNRISITGFFMLHHEKKCDYIFDGFQFEQTNLNNHSHSKKQSRV